MTPQEELTLTIDVADLIRCLTVWRQSLIPRSTLQALVEQWRKTAREAAGTEHWQRAYLFDQCAHDLVALMPKEP